MTGRTEFEWVPDWYYPDGGSRTRPTHGPETIPLGELATPLPVQQQQQHQHQHRRQPQASASSTSQTLPTAPNQDSGSNNNSNSNLSGSGQNGGQDPGHGGGTASKDGFSRREKFVVVTPSKDRTVDRKLGGLQLAMITVNATLGTGLYWRGGQILELGGPLAVLLAYLVPGFLAWAVMQCITEMLCIWPVPGALSVYVSEFVDVELGLAVGIAYWFTYSVSFAALIATAAAEIHFWVTGKGLDGGVVYFLIPLVLVVLNSFPVSLYGWMEVITSSLKLVFLLIVICFLIAINVGIGTTDSKPIGDKYWQKPTAYDKDVAQNWVASLFISISLAAFAYVGVEIVAASALEARWPNQNARTPTDLSQRSEQDLLIGKTVKFSAVYMPIIFTVAYVLSGVLAWVAAASSNTTATVDAAAAAAPPPLSGEGSSTSVFVAIAQETTFPHLADVFNVFLVFTALSCANTNLYVASRSLFGLASRLDGGSRQSRPLRVLAWFGRTNSHKVPIRAVVFSALAFWWVPFLQLRSGEAIDAFIDILGNMGSVGVIIVWACECWAFIRFYRCIYRHRTALQTQRIAQVRRWDTEDWNDYPYRSHLQPFLAYVALAGCLIILVIVDGAVLWNAFDTSSFLSAYLVIIVFLALWALLKVERDANWALVDLHNETKVINKIKELHDFRLGAS
ncbi:Lysine/arginine permease CAN1-like protein [Cladobotryum mycophilum]|uniref:Lysine/arginine permease CAN1-like protein n=1 Tax=Cladobotryum mycophilum TaxID=491253 RepID=A0ABR0SNU5_9HYPO